MVSDSTENKLDDNQNSINNKFIEEQSNLKTFESRTLAETKYEKLF